LLFLLCSINQAIKKRGTQRMMDGGDEEFSSVAQQRSDEPPTLPPKYSDDDAVAAPDVTVAGPSGCCSRRHPTRSEPSPRLLL
jgi:hypothetical protein